MTAWGRGQAERALMAGALGLLTATGGCRAQRHGAQQNTAQQNTTQRNTDQQGQGNGGQQADAPSGNKFETIDYPNAGEIVYGTIGKGSTLAEAMGSMLRSAHKFFGDRPVLVGQLFQARGSNSVASFFTVTMKNMPGDRATAGMVIVSVPPGGAPEGAVVFDYAERFNKTMSPMMNKLNEVWHPQGGAQEVAASGGKGEAPAQPLSRMSFPDNSGTISLPQGWRITSGYQGAVHAEGPSGAQVHFGEMYPVMDPNSPQTQQMLETNRQYGQGLPGSYTVYPYGGDAARAFVAVVNQLEQKYRKPATAFNFTSVKHVGNSVAGDCTQTVGTLDRHDGRGEMSAWTTICVNAPTNGLWMMSAYQTAVPVGKEAEEAATLAAIGQTYNVNGQVVGEESQATIDTIKRNTAASMKQSADSFAAFDQKLAADRAAEDRQDKRSQAFSNYQLDYSVIQDNETGGHATTYNNYAAALVQADPNRYQYVPTPDFLKGIDY